LYFVKPQNNKNPKKKLPKLIKSYFDDIGLNPKDEQDTSWLIFGSSDFLQFLALHLTPND